MARHSSIKGAHPSCPEIRLKLTVHRRPPTSSPLSELTRPASALQFGSVPEFGSRGEWGNGGSRDAVPPPLRDPRAVPRRAAPRRRRVRAPPAVSCQPRRRRLSLRAVAVDSDQQGSPEPPDQVNQTAPRLPP